MSLFAEEIYHILEELASLKDAFLQEIYQPNPTDLIFEFRLNHTTNLLFISVHRDFARIHLVKKRPKNPKNPLNFQMLCRKEIHGKLLSITQENNDRTISIKFQGDNIKTVIVEFSNTYSNIFLLNEDNIIFGTILPIKGDSRTHKVATPYQQRDVQKIPQIQKIEKLRFDSNCNIQTYQEQVEEYYDNIIEKDKNKKHLLLIIKSIITELKKNKKKLALLEGDLEKAIQAESFQKFGDIIQIYLNQIPKHISEITLQDPFKEEVELITIILDPKLSPVDNAQQYYKKYKKYNTRTDEIIKRIDNTENRMKILKKLQTLLETNTENTQIDALNEIIKQYDIKIIKKQIHSKQKEYTRLPFIKYQTNNSTNEIWIGRSAKDNALLTFKHAKGNDFWLHAIGIAGAHTVIPFKGSPPDLETLILAAELTLKHSGFSQGDKSEVAYTRVKYVKKIAGDNLGKVVYSQEKSLMVEISNNLFEKIKKID